MEECLLTTVIYTIEEICFTAHLLLANEEAENRIIINTYKSLSDDVVHSTKEVSFALLLTMKREGSFSGAQIPKETLPQRKDYSTNDGIVDSHISDYFHIKRSGYTVDKERKDYLIREIIGI